MTLAVFNLSCSFSRQREI